jgi:hypothetical protein
VSCGLNSDNYSHDNHENYSIVEKVSVNRMISLTGKLVHGTEERSYISEAQIILRYKIREHFLRERPKYAARPAFQEMFKNAST